MIRENIIYPNTGPKAWQLYLTFGWQKSQITALSRVETFDEVIGKQMHRHLHVLQLNGMICSPRHVAPVIAPNKSWIKALIRPSGLVHEGTETLELDYNSVR